jgi:glucan phosphoethanolaminetransferase (alkaline phosphatase superfamily)
MQNAPIESLAVVGAAFLIWSIFILSFAVLIAVVWWQIFKKAGFHPSLGLLMLLPIVNIIMLFVFAFTKWPVYDKLSKEVMKERKV